MAESKQDLLHVVVVEPEKVPYEQAIQPGLRPMQEVVGGTIQALYPFPEPIALICNDEGRFWDCPSTEV